MSIGLAVLVLVLVLAIVLAVAVAVAAVALVDRDARDGAATPAARGGSRAPILAEAEGIGFERYQLPDLTVPAVPGRPVERFRVAIDEHVTRVGGQLGPTEVSTFGVNGRRSPGTGGTRPIVVIRETRSRGGVLGDPGGVLPGRAGGRRRS